MSVTNPYLYWSTSMRRTCSTVSCTAGILPSAHGFKDRGLDLSVMVARAIAELSLLDGCGLRAAPQAAMPRLSLSSDRASIFQVSTNRSTSAVGGAPAEADAHRAARELGLDAHGRQHMRGLHLAGRAGRTRTTPLSRRDRRRSPRSPPSAREPRTAWCWAAAAPCAEDHRLRRRRLDAGLQPRRAAPPCARRQPAVAAARRRPPRRSRRWRRRSRCRRAGRAPGRRRGSAARRCGCRRGATSAPTPCGPPSLCAESVSRSAPSAVDVAIDAAGRLHRVDMQQRRRRHARCRRSRAIGWITPVSLLASMTETSGRSALRKRRCASASRSTTPSRVDRQSLDCIRRRNARRSAPRDARSPTRTAGRATPCARQPRAPASAPACWPRCAPLVKVTFFGSAPTKRGDLARAPPRPGAARPAPRHGPRTDCRSASSAADHRRARLRPQRRGGVPVEIDALAHGSSGTLLPLLPPDPAKCLLFAPGVVLEADARRDAYSACSRRVHSGDSLYLE